MNQTTIKVIIFIFLTVISLFMSFTTKDVNESSILASLSIISGAYTFRYLPKQSINEE